LDKNRKAQGKQHVISREENLSESAFKKRTLNYCYHLYHNYPQRERESFWLAFTMLLNQALRLHYIILPSIYGFDQIEQKVSVTQYNRFNWMIV